jgi:hypothetical protein
LEKTISAYATLEVNLLNTGHIEDLEREGRIILSWILERNVVRMGVARIARDGVQTWTLA